jgi:predicted membrane-bound dolichyl-phosphate-mannose-protein mannosyltransferase
MHVRQSGNVGASVCRGDFIPVLKPLRPKVFRVRWTRNRIRWQAAMRNIDRNLPTQSTVWSALIISNPPNLTLAPRVVQTQEPVLVQALPTQVTIERHDVCIICLLSSEWRRGKLLALVMTRSGRLAIFL